MPPRGRRGAVSVPQSKKKNAIRSRSGQQVAPQSRSSLVITKLPLWKIRSALHSLYFLFHRRRYPSFLAIPRPLLATTLCFFLFPRRHREISNALSHPPSSITFPPLSSLFHSHPTILSSLSPSLPFTRSFLFHPVFFSINLRRLSLSFHQTVPTRSFFVRSGYHDG